MHTEFTARNVVKYVVKATVHSAVAQRAEDIITDYTRFEEDDTVVKISSHLVGWYVSDKLKPVTDKMVDKTADYVAAKREARCSKKETKKTEDQ